MRIPFRAFRVSRRKWKKKQVKILFMVGYTRSKSLLVSLNFFVRFSSLFLFASLLFSNDQRQESISLNEQVLLDITTVLRRCYHGVIQDQLV